MKRPLCTIGFSALCVLAAAFCFPPKVWLCMGAGLLLIWGISLLFSKSKGVVRLVLMSMAMACLYAYGSYALRTEPLLELDGKTLPVTGTVLESEQHGEHKTYTVLLSQVGGRKVFADKLWLHDYDCAGLIPGDTFTAPVGLFAQADERDFSIFFLAKGITLGGVLAGEPAILPDTLLSPVCRLRASMIGELRSLIPGDRGEIAVGIFTGDKSGISSETIVAFRRSGMSHILAVSGLHLTLLTLMASFPLRKAPRKLRAVFLILFILLFMAFELFSYSVLRAGIMLLVLYLGELLTRRTDAFNSLGFALLLILLFSPYAAGDVGLELSVSAVVGILLLSKPIERRLEKVCPDRLALRKLCAILSVSLAATIGIAPVSLWRFGQVFVFSFLTALPVAFLTPLSLVCSLLAPLCSFASLPKLAGLFAAWDALAVSGLKLCAEVVAKLPFGMLYDRDLPFLMGIGFAGLLLWALIVRRKKKFRLALLLAILSAAGVTACGAVEYHLSATPYLVFPDGESAYSAVLTHGGDTVAVLGDCTKDTAADLLSVLERYRCQEIDALYLVGDSFQDGESCRIILEDFPVKRLYLSADSASYRALSVPLRRADLVMELRDSAFSLPKGWNVKENAGSLYLSLEGQHRLAFLFGEKGVGEGACLVVAEEVLPGLPPNADIYLPADARRTDGDERCYFREESVILTVPLRLHEPET